MTAEPLELFRERATWSTALPDWRDRIRTGASLVPDLPLFRAEADRALRIFKRLRIPDVIGTPTMAEACGPWFFGIVEAVFGSYDPETHRRMISEFFLMVPKKNSKSSGAGALMLTALIMNRRPEGEFNVIAPTLQVAGISFKQAADTVRIDPELDKLFQIQAHARTIQHRTTGAKLQIKAADTDVVTGGKPVATLIDETHVFASHSRAEDVFVEIRGALAARPDGFLLQTTTQSKEPPSGVFANELAIARQVRDGEMDLPLLPILYELPEDMIDAEAWRRPDTWGLVNPNLGRSVDEAFLEREIRTAEFKGPGAMALFASQHLNVEIGLRLRKDRWVGADLWEAAVEPIGSLDELLERSEVVTVGVDGGGMDDLLGFAVIGRDKASKSWIGWARAWANRKVLERRKDVAPALLDFERDGDLVLCADSTQDVEEVAELIAAIDESGLLPDKLGIGLDRYSIGAVVDALAARGIEGERLAGIAQGTALSPAIWTLERKLGDGTFRHCGQRLLTWSVGNARAEQRGNAVYVTKETAGRSKIDPLVALFCAAKLMSDNPAARGNPGVTLL